MIEYAVVASHNGFVDRFLRDEVPPDNIGTTIWWAVVDHEILRFKDRESAERLKKSYKLHFVEKGEKAYTFAVMRTVITSKWIPVDD